MNGITDLPLLLLLCHLSVSVLLRDAYDWTGHDFRRSKGRQCLDFKQDNCCEDGACSSLDSLSLNMRNGRKDLNDGVGNDCTFYRCFRPPSSLFNMVYYVPPLSSSTFTNEKWFQRNGFEPEVVCHWSLIFHDLLISFFPLSHSPQECSNESNEERILTKNERAVIIFSHKSRGKVGRSSTLVSPLSFFSFLTSSSAYRINREKTVIGL